MGRAIIMYGASPRTGVLREDHAMHGACPVLDDAEKWGLNVWIWNGPRPELLIETNNATLYKNAYK